MATKTITSDAVETTPANTDILQSTASANVDNSIELPNDVVEPRAESRNKVGDIKTEIIRTCVEIIPRSGSNAGKQMYLINGKHWSRHAPADTHNTIVLEYTEWTSADNTIGGGFNVVGFNTDSRTLTIDEKIGKLTAHDAAYSQALAFLLK
jgi:hypothetical protein